MSNAAARSVTSAGRICQSRTVYTSPILSSNNRRNLWRAWYHACRPARGGCRAKSGEALMPEQELPKYHLSEQRADAILRPMALTLAELETRAQHFLDRLRMVEEDRAAVAAA